MVASRHITKIIAALMAVAVILCILAMAFSEQLNEALGGTGVTMEYESKLFNTDEIMSVDIQMSEEQWETMLKNATSEVYYVCDVVINGQKVTNVAIRPKGNTSLSAIATDPDSDRFSFKLEFDHYVEGQTCYGLDKLILNNNYADATNMKEAIIYDMYGYLGADASLYNYAEVSVNGEYWGVYLALEAVEQSFMLRNYGAQDGELYKPDTMDMGDKEASGSSSGMPSMGDASGFDFSNIDTSQFEGKSRPGSSTDGESTETAESTETTESAETTESGDTSGRPSMGDFDSSNMPDMSNFDSSSMPDMSNFDSSNMPDMSNLDPSNMPDMSNFDPSNMPDMGDFDPSSMMGGGSTSTGSDSGETASTETESTESTETTESTESSGRPSMGDFDPSSMMGGGGFGGMGGGSNSGGANLNYIDDDLDSYSEIWNAEVTKTGKKDHKRVVEALKNISEGNDLEKYLDVDNVLKYMAVHTFSVNMDSLSGNMSHNYYLYEYDGQLNIIPWDYNLSFGGLAVGMSATGESDMINDAIDTPFSGTKFFDALLENEEYLARYHEYLNQLVEEYVFGGRFDEVYGRIRSQIDGLVETDPTAFYTYDEYNEAAEMFYKVIQLRAESIRGQLDGAIPSTDEGQKADSSNFVDASEIDIDVMGTFDMGFGSKSDDEDSDSTEAPADGDTTTDSGDSGSSSRPSPPSGGSFDMSSMPSFDSSNMPTDFDASSLPEGFDMSNMPSMGGFGGMGGSGASTQDNTMKNAIYFGVSFVLLIIALIGVTLYKRRKFIKRK